MSAGPSAESCRFSTFAFDIVSKSGSFFSYGNDRLGQGRGNAKAHLDANPAMGKEIEEKIYAALGVGQGPVTAITPSGTDDRDATGSAPQDAKKPPLASEPVVAAA